MEARCDRLLVHFDVDVIDFTDMPLSENWGRNEGLPFVTAMDALDVLLRSSKLVGLTITECNPDHAEEGAAGLERLVATVAAALAAA
jgi:arginase